MNFIETDNPSVVQEQAELVFLKLFPEGDHAFINQSFSWINKAFSGEYKNYLPIDLNYHNYEHTLQVTSCMMNLLQTRHLAHDQPILTEKMFELSLLAILLHDTGYLKTDDDRDGTGAKYTLIHVSRSCEFAAKLLTENGFAPDEITSIQNMIRCTGVNVDLDKISFQSELEKTLGFILGTSDLVGQMAAHNYVKKLPFLFLEFQESFNYSQKTTQVAEIYKSEEDLMRNTPIFWGKYVKPKIDLDFRMVYKYLNDPYPDGKNHYIENIEANINNLKDRFKYE